MRPDRRSLVALGEEKDHRLQRQADVVPVELAMRDVPDYAKPRRYLAISDHEFNRLGLLTANSRPRRAAIRRLLSDWSHFLSSQSI